MSFAMPWNYAVFLAALVTYHLSEFTLAFVFMREELSWSSWLITKPYLGAMLIANVEFFLEMYFAPTLKLQSTFFLACAGMCLVLAGELIRKTGMLTARGNFTHMIRRTRHPDHTLVTWGIYRFIRHPGYLGWAVWAVGTQVLLVNPLSAVLFAVLALRFFSRRIPYEEALLRRMFPEYDVYRARTPTWMPFIP